MSQMVKSKRNANRIREGSRTVTFLIYAFITFLCFITIYPMYFCVIKSISDPLLSLKQPVTFWPAGFYLGLYKPIVTNMDMWRSYAYTIFYTISGTVLMLVTSVLGAYPLVNKKLRGRKLIVAFLLIPMYFSGGLIPSYMNNIRLGLYNNVWVMIIPGAVGIWNIILVRTYFNTSVPNELVESAEIDGAGCMTILTKIYVPLSKPVLAVIAVYTIVGKWNDWFTAMVYLRKTSIQPLQMYLKRLLVSQTVDISKMMTQENIAEAIRQSVSAQQMKYALIVFVTLPIILVYPMFQKYFVKGIMLGSLKG